MKKKKQLKLNITGIIINNNITLGHNDWGTYSLEQAEHFWPQYSNEDRMVPVTTDVTSADGCTKW